MLTAQNILQTALKKFPDNAALCIGSKEYSYHDLLVGLETSMLKLMGTLGHPGAIAVLANKSLNGYRAIAGAFLSGKTYVPLNARYPDLRNLKILDESGVSVLFIDAALRPQAESLGKLTTVICVVFDHDEDGSLNLEIIEHNLLLPIPFNQNKYDSLAYLLFTSGSTGAPKGVPISHHNLAVYLTNIAEVCDFRESDRFSQFFDFTFDLSLHDILVCWSAGACLCPPGGADLLMPMHFAKKQRLTIWFSVPSLALTAKDLLKSKFVEFDLQNLRTSLFCGEVLPQSLLQQWYSITQSPVINLYGPTEATIAITQQTYRNQDDISEGVRIGLAFGNNKIAVFDEQGSLSDRGELYLGGEQVFSGYWQRGDLSGKVLHQTDHLRQLTWYRSGDICSIDTKGQITLHGRADRQVQIGGFRVELPEVEQVIRSVTEVGTVAVIANSDCGVSNARSLIAFISKEAAEKSSQSVLRSHCEQVLPSYMVPDKFLFIDQFPYNDSGKLDYQQLYKLIKED